MQRLTAQGRATVDEIAERHGFSNEAVTQMLFAVAAGNGAMAMFDHRDFGGPGQWMRGGMLMLSDASNRALEGRVEGLCQELSKALEARPAVLEDVGAGERIADWQRQWAHTGDDAPAEPEMPALSPGAQPDDISGAPWWPAAFGVPNATGSQNGLRYAYFGDARRLVIDDGTRVRIYDTGDHRIQGISQADTGRAGGTAFSSQRGRVDLDQLSLVSHSEPASAADPVAGRPDPGPLRKPGRDGLKKKLRPQVTDIFTTIERLGDLKAKGLLTEQEFLTKKTELLARL